MRYIRKLFFFFLILLQAGIVHAHVQLIYPSGGETFSAGSEITITWQESINHGPSNWDIYFSEDNGSSWQTVVMNLSQSKLSYDWQIPSNIATTQAKIRVDQDNETGADYSSASGLFTILGTTGLSKSNDAHSKIFTLYPAFPNPFNGNVTISFSLSKNDHVEINIYNVLGKKVEKLFDNTLNAGTYKMNWQPQNLPSAIYYYTIRSGLYSETKRLVYIK